MNLPVAADSGAAIIGALAALSLPAVPSGAEQIPQPTLASEDRPCRSAGKCVDGGREYAPMKDYLLLILTACAPENGFAQDAIEWAIVSNHITLTYHPAHDVMTIMGLYDKIIDGYRSARQDADLLPVFADNIREAA